MKHGWEYKKLGEICQIVTGSTPKTSVQEYWGGKYPWVTPAELKGDVFIDDTERHITDEAVAHTNVTLLPIGTVLLSSRAPIGKVAITTREMYCNQGFKNLICSDTIFNKYLYFWLKGKTDYLNSLGRGATFKEISKSIVENIQIPLPPIQSQQSIVSELDKINELICLKKEQLKDYDNLAQSIFYEMFGDPVVNEKGWEVKKLGEVCTYPNKRISLSDITSYEYVGVETLVKNKGGVLFTEELPNAKNAIEYIENDILIGNIRPYLKKIWKSDRHGGASGDVVIIRISDTMKGLLTPVYLFKLLSTDEFFEYDNANTHGAKMPRGDRKAIGEFTIQIPPMHLQHIFAQRIELIERQKAEIQSTIADLETLLASRMQYWFD